MDSGVFPSSTKMRLVGTLCFPSVPNKSLFLSEVAEKVCLDGVGFHNFRLRGEGLSSFVVSATRQDGKK